MTSQRSSVAPSDGEDVVLADLIEAFTARLRAGESLDAEAFAAEHPAYADRLRRVLPGVQVLADLSPSGSADATSDPPAPAPEGLPGGVLGDFRIVREVGRGGMGVVYEAEQVSLRRRVALKVLPFAATMDARQLQRFHNEARAAAGLHHEHIVPVHAVGCERGVHFYAMQFIDGETLAQRIAQLRGMAGVAATRHASPAGGATTPYAPLPVPAAEPGRPGAAAARKAVPAGPHYRRVARWGLQAAEALEYAHGVGVVHRDIKPGNLMVDGQARVWVTDFGLARTAADPGLTQTGDLLGTLRYMSPEQALARHGLVDHRTDVYSLGATLYELLTLRPAVGGSDRQDVLRRIAFEEPVPPRRRNKAIPAELEVVVLKAMEKNPADRYATAGELADDLRRWLADEPIRARRPSRLRRLRKWAGRHQPLVTALALTLMLTLVTLAVGNFLIWWTNRQAEERIGRAKQELQEAQRQVQLYRQEANVHIAAHLSEIKDAVREVSEPRFAALREVDALADAALGQLPVGSTEPTPAQRTVLRSVARLYEALLDDLVPPGGGQGRDCPGGACLVLGSAHPVPSSHRGRPDALPRGRGRTGGDGLGPRPPPDGAPIPEALRGEAAS